MAKPQYLSEYLNSDSINIGNVRQYLTDQEVNLCNFKGHRKGTSRARRSRSVAKAPDSDLLTTLEDQQEEPDTENEEPVVVLVLTRKTKKRGFPSTMELSRMNAR